MSDNRGERMNAGNEMGFLFRSFLKGVLIGGIFILILCLV